MKSIFGPLRHRINSHINKSRQRLDDAASLGPFRNDIAIVTTKIKSGNLDGAETQLSNLVASSENYPGIIDDLKLYIAAAREDVRLLCPGKFMGVIDHYHPFIGGILLPFLELLSVGVIRRGDKLLCPSCGPLTSELEEVATLAGVELRFFSPQHPDHSQRTSAIVRRAVPRPKGGDVPKLFESLAAVPNVILPGSDFSFESDWLVKPHLRKRALNQLFSIMGIEWNPSRKVQIGQEARILLIDRAAPEPYYNSPRTLRLTSGSQRRSLPNATEILDAIKEEFPNAARIHTEKASLTEKITAFHSADVVIGQTGAGLNCAYWMRPGCSMIEILSQELPRPNFVGFGNVAVNCDLLHYRVIQESDHAPVDPQIVLSYLRAALQDMESAR